MYKQIELLVAISFFIIGLSHFLQPKPWIDFFRLLLKQGYAGVFINGLLTLPLGVLIVAFHNSWRGGSTIVTVIGYAYLIKSLVAFCFPALGYRSMSRVQKDNRNEFRYGGLLMVLLAAVIFYFYSKEPLIPIP